MQEQGALSEIPEEEPGSKDWEQMKEAGPEEGEQRDDETNLEALRAQPHLEVYQGHVLLAGESNRVERMWAEGKQSKEAQGRYRKVIAALTKGFLDQKIEAARSPEITPLSKSISWRISEQI